MKNIKIWKSSSSISTLKKRAFILSKIRKFFTDRGVLEVETPILSHSATTEVNLSSFKTFLKKIGEKNKDIPLYLITSPEFHMKRLLASGSGPIFQICHSFRNQEVGRYHNPEFTILEWYQLNYDMNHLIDEVIELIKLFIKVKNIKIISYKELYIRYIGIDPLSSNKKELYKIINSFNLNKIVSKKDDYCSLIQLIFTLLVEPKLKMKELVFVYHFPSFQSELAKINMKDNRVSDRFEVYYKGIELANGSCELIDYDEQYRRFLENNKRRVLLGLEKQPFDRKLLNAFFSKKMPECSGVALGIDRLLMIILKKNSLRRVIPFTIDYS